MKTNPYYPQITVEQKGRYTWTITVALGPEDMLSPRPYKSGTRPALRPVAELKDAVLPLLERFGSPIQAAELRAELPQLGYAAANVLSALYKEGWLTRSGSGRHRDPFRYSVRVLSKNV